MLFGRSLQIQKIRDVNRGIQIIRSESQHVPHVGNGNLCRFMKIGKNKMLKIEIARHKKNL